MLTSIPESGDVVIIRTPENPRLNASQATVREVADWGCHLIAPAAATGQFRAAWHEMEERPSNGRPLKKSYTAIGDECSRCGGMNVVQTGTCKTCQDCGESVGGCG